MKTIIRNCNPLSEYDRMNSMIDQILARGEQVQSAQSHILPVDVSQTETALIIRASVPGISPTELFVEIEDQTLTIRGETKKETLEDEKIYRNEISYGSFTRSIRLPDQLEVDKTTAKFDNGMVKISIPKIPIVKPVAIKVEVQTNSSESNN
ncbi:MAG: Hsp20/alpha crystallin family protein [Armatimonadetes bacterium]|nr:Hsp20/alpha crystallin family protein [Armatimonadota bacterium]